LGGIKNPKMFKIVSSLKQKALELDSMRIDGKISGETAFKLMVSISDLQGDIESFESAINNIQKEDFDYTTRVALLGVPPINYDFHKVLESLGFHVVFDELPYEFTRLSGNNMDELAKNYCDYTFARNIEFRLNFLKNELKRRNVEGIIHYTQFACHHLLEDEILRKNLNYPFLTIQGDLPGKTSRSALLRLEAFSEMLSDL
jgi:benzoyl-CoA reductase/2-hydroxyglutaryl-CoA dehydratase subunit BcrC/BadD/HgdB